MLCFRTLRATDFEEYTMEIKHSARNNFLGIVDALQKDVYTVLDSKHSHGNKQQAVRTVVPQTRHALSGLVKATRRQAQVLLKKGEITPRQNAAITELLDQKKKEQLARLKFLEKPRVRFQSEGDWYELVNLGNGRFSFVNMREFEKLSNGDWRSKRDPEKRFATTPIPSGCLYVSPNQLCDISDHLITHYIADDLIEMINIRRQQNWRPYDRGAAKVVLQNQPNGSYILRPSSQAGFFAISYKVNGEIYHNLVDEESGELKFANEYPRTLFQLVSELRQESARSAPAVQEQAPIRSRPAPGVPRHGAANEARNLQQRPLGNSRPVERNFATNQMNQFGMPEGRHRVQEKRPNPSHVDGHRNHAARNQRTAPQSPIKNQVDAEAYIAQQPVGCAVRFQRNDKVYLLIKATTRDGERLFQTQYFGQGQVADVRGQKVTLSAYITTKHISEENIRIVA
jgi:hypothetical protein